MILWYLHISLFVAGVLLNVWGIHRFQYYNPANRFKQHALHQDNSNRNPDPHCEASVYKGQPRQELDDAWQALVDQPMILVDGETLQSFDPTEKPSKGIHGHYYATVEVYHQLHCLDITRKFIWRDHYKHVDTFQDPPEMVWEHVDHCIDLLRQVLMCNSDIGLIFYTDRGNGQPDARVSTIHSCRNFTAITEWVNQHDSEQGIFVGAV